MKRLIPLALALSASPALAKEGMQDGLQRRVAAVLASAGSGIRFGMVVADADGHEIVAIDPNGRYIPASNTKLFTTAAAFATLPGIDAPDTVGGASVRLDAQDGGVTDVVLVGHGDARLSSAADCLVDCLATLADAVASNTRQVRDVVGDDSLFPDQRWSPGMSWNNIPTRSGTAASALTLDDNEVVLKVTPGAVGAPPEVAGDGYYTIDDRAVSAASGARGLAFDRAPNTRVLRLTGTIATSETLRLGVDDPAERAAWIFAAMLRARGVTVTGAVATRHRPAMPADDPALRRGSPPARPAEPAALARLVAPPLAEDLRHTNKVSQNLHAELLLRRIGRVNGNGSIADGLAAVRAVLTSAGVPRADYDFSDGSGMSTYNRVVPRGPVIFLRWIAAQPWGAAWRETLPVGAVDGTLARRFEGTGLERRVFAKTGALNATAALAGYMIGRGGRLLTFAIYANDVPETANATRVIDRALELVAAEN